MEAQVLVFVFNPPRCLYYVWPGLGTRSTGQWLTNKHASESAGGLVKPPHWASAPELLIQLVWDRA